MAKSIGVWAIGFLAGAAVALGVMSSPPIHAQIGLNEQAMQQEMVAGLSRVQAENEKKIAWLEKELARIAHKVDQTVKIKGYDTPTPRN